MTHMRMHTRTLTAAEVQFITQMLKVSTKNRQEFAKMMLLPLLIFLWITSGSTSKLSKNIKCIVMDLEYINCTWDKDGIPQENYKFYLVNSCHKPEATQECASYIKNKGVNVGCIVPYDEKKVERFNILQACLYRDNGTFIGEHNRQLTNMVKLAPPVNLMVEFKRPELWLYWTSSNRTNPHCKESQVRYRINNNEWLVQNPNPKDSFNVAFPNNQSLYELQVRVRMSSQCGQSEQWSEWSKSVCWGSLKDINDTETRQSSSVALMMMCTAGAAIVLIILSCLLVHSERLRVILVPVVPNPKNLADLIESYDGNVEKWLSISKELQDGFKPNFTERTCPVREYRLMSQSSTESDGSSLSGPTDLSSDYQPMHCCSSTSTLLDPAESTQTSPMPTAPNMQ